MALPEKLPAPSPAPRPPRVEPLSSVDYAWLRMDEPENLMMISGVLAMGSRVDLDGLREVVEGRLLPIARFHQRVVVPAGGGARWEPDPDFDLDHHLVAAELPAPGGDAELRALIEGLVSAPLDPERPLWQFHLIGNYKRGSALFGRLHHSIGDGVALMMVLLSLTDRTPDEPAAAHPGSPFSTFLHDPHCDLAATRALIEEVMPDGIRLLLNPVEAFQKAGRLATGAAATGALGRLVARPADPPTILKGPLGIPKCVAWSEPIPVARVKAVGRALEGTVNDVLLAAMAGALRRYLEGRGERVAGLNVRAAMPVNLRGLEKMAELGNQFGLVFLSLPLGIADPAARLAELARRARALKRSAEPVVVYAILRLLGRVPMAVQRLVVKIFGTKATAVMTNIPGPREVLYLAGESIDDIFFWVPQSGRVGLGISICSYAGRVRLGVGTDAGLIPDPEVIVAAFHDEIEALAARTGVDGAGGRIPVHRGLGSPPVPGRPAQRR